jgi:hypothetical protein
VNEVSSLHRVEGAQKENCSVDPMGSRSRLPKFLQESFPLLRLPPLQPAALK